MLGRSLRPLFERRFWLNVLLVLCVTPLAAAESLTLPRAERPEWLQRDGIVMAGSWEPLVFRVRRGPQGGTPPSLDSPPGNGYEPSAGQRAAYEKEHGPEMVADLKRLGVNFVMLHGYKGAGMAAEGESMKDAARFARLCRDSGLRVGSYLDSATLLVELLFKERPDAKDWIVRDRDGNPLFYGNASYRYRWNRNHPDAHRYYLDVLRAAIAEIQPDLVHLDNYIYGPDCDATSVGQFRAYLRRTFTPEQLRAGGIDDVDKAQPATSGPPDSLLRRAWIDFACQWLADSYYARTRFARTLRKDVLMECNPGGVGCAIHVPVDHARLVQGGEAFWDEGAPLPRYQGKGPLETRIRSYKVARRNDNMVFCYTTTPLELAEAMAFNLDCLGCVCFFEYGIVRSRPWLEDGVSPDARRYIQFFHDRRGVLRRRNGGGRRRRPAELPVHGLRRPRGCPAHVPGGTIPDRGPRVLPDHLPATPRRPGPLSRACPGRVHGAVGPADRADPAVRRRRRASVRHRTAGDARRVDVPAQRARIDRSPGGARGSPQTWRRSSRRDWPTLRRPLVVGRDAADRGPLHQVDRAARPADGPPCQLSLGRAGPRGGGRRAHARRATCQERDPDQPRSPAGTDRAVYGV